MESAISLNIMSAPAVKPTALLVLAPAASTAA